VLRAMAMLQERVKTAKSADFRVDPEIEVMVFSAARRAGCC
jgi:hypothetical protein